MRPTADPESGLPRRRRTGLRTGIVLLVVGIALGAVGDVRFRSDYAALVVPSRAMSTTLNPGDVLLVRSPTAGAPHRGDIVVVAPSAWSLNVPLGTPIIKRVIGVAGDTVMCCDDRGRITVNGKPVTEDYLHRDPELPVAAPTAVPFAARTVPADSVFLAGDSRANSFDSRFAGPVAVSDVLGIAVTDYPLSWPYVSVPTTHAFVDAGLPGAPTTDNGYQLDLVLLLVALVLAAVGVVWLTVIGVREVFRFWRPVR
ncbi:MAG TPA: signal peptidase I [Pseudonocardiaceae bacterium]|jgi:signal peptidase I|nr:signal peptidase I [Pseudonocardiaceae bacterium]